ncbi:PREDICTED: premnaspirodiene oxygenase-like [Ipomoea nil]|uniref:premnaspirodiene oxygenase-like n=1 Tax=Ipomoea nil TaxID=35883 RepID=UPI000901C158|nr:PREDICTED: premnaspirodiene oxygenase-like [Ipomoea nil]
MEVAFNFISFVFFLSFFILLHTQWRKKAKTRRNLPPGPPELPIIGNLHELMSDSQQPTHRVLGELVKKYGSQGMMKLQIGEILAVVVSSPAVAKELLRTHDLTFTTKTQSLASKTLFYNGLGVSFSPYGDYWRQLRKIFAMELLNAKIVRSFSSIRRDEIHCLLAYLHSSSGQMVNITERIFLLMSSIICKSAFGEVFNGREEFLEQVKEISELLGKLDLAGVFPSWKVLHGLCSNKNRIMKTHRKVDAIIENIIKEKLESGNKGRSGDSLIDVLVTQMDSSGLQLPITHDTIKAVIADMFAGGSETSTATTVWAMSEMMKNPRVMEKAQTEVREVFKGKETLDEKDIIEQLPYLKQVVKETLRCHPPFPVFSPRECREESIVNGYTIPLETKVIINAWAIGRDSKYWEDPESFIPERFEESSIDFTGNHFQYLPFGAGRRICPGLAFGFANSISPLGHLLFHFDWKLPNGVTVDSFDMTEKPGLSVGRKTDLCLIATPHIA